MLRVLAIIGVICLLQVICRNDPLSTLIKYEEKQRSSAQLDSNDYNLIPFRLSNTPQHFILAPTHDQTISVEVVVHWINSNATLQFPVFDLAQKVRLAIEEETYGVTEQKPIITKEFLTQTGFKVKLFAGKKYRVRLESAGKQVKLVEIAMTNRQHAAKTFQPITKNHTNEMRVLQEMRANLEEAQMRWAQRSHHSEKEEEADSIWAWMSGIEMVSLLTFVGVQIFLFDRFSLPSSVI